MIKGIIWTAEVWFGKWAALLDTSNIFIFQNFEARWKFSTKNKAEDLFKGEEKGTKNIDQHKARDNKIKNRAQAKSWIYLQSLQNLKIVIFFNYEELQRAWNKEWTTV